MHPHLRLTLFAAWACVPLTAAQALPNTWHVDVNAAGPGSGTTIDPFQSLQFAISRPTTLDGDTLLVEPGEYVENIDNLQKSLTIQSAQGPLATTIRAAQPGRVVKLFGNYPESATLIGFTITGLTVPPDPGAHLPVAGVYLVFARLRECIVRDNVVVPSSFGPFVGAGVFADGDAYIERCTIVGNSYGVAENIYGAAFIDSSIVWGNHAPFGYAYSIQHSILDGQDPLFWDLSRPDFHLRPGSPAIDGGNPALPHDPDGTVADIGALAFEPAYAPPGLSYCSGKLNGQGCVPEVATSGVCSATSGLPFVVTASLVSSNKFGRLFYGYAPAAIPFVGGLRCIATPTARTPLSNSGGTGQPCSGVLSFEFNARIRSGIDPGLVPGRMVYAQYWYRDPSDPAGFGVGLTNATSFGIAP